MNDSNVIELKKPPETAEDALVCVLRRGALNSFQKYTRRFLGDLIKTSLTGLTDR